LHLFNSTPEIIRILSNMKEPSKVIELEEDILTTIELDPWKVTEQRVYFKPEHIGFTGYNRPYWSRGYRAAFKDNESDFKSYDSDYCESCGEFILESESEDSMDKYGLNLCSKCYRDFKNYA